MSSTPHFELDGQNLYVYIPVDNRYGTDRQQRAVALIGAHLVPRLQMDVWVMGDKAGAARLRVAYDPNGPSVERQAEEAFERGKTALDDTIAESERLAEHVKVLHKIGALGFLTKHNHEPAGG